MERLSLLITNLSPSVAGDAPVRELSTVGKLNPLISQITKTWQVVHAGSVNKEALEMLTTIPRPTSSLFGLSNENKKNPRPTRR